MRLGINMGMAIFEWAPKTARSGGRDMRKAGVKYRKIKKLLKQAGKNIFMETHFHHKKFGYDGYTEYIIDMVKLEWR